MYMWGRGYRKGQVERVFSVKLFQICLVYRIGLLKLVDQVVNFFDKYLDIKKIYFLMWQVKSIFLLNWKVLGLNDNYIQGYFRE